MRRAFLTILVLVLGLLLIAAVTVFFVLRSDLPRRIVTNLVAEETGLRIEMDALETTWRGRTTVRGLRAGLPLESQAFVHVPELRLRHNGLISLALTRQLILSEATLVSPSLTVEPDSSGRWNLLRAAGLIADAQGGGDDLVAGPEQFPWLRVIDAEVNIAAADGSLQKYTGLEFTGEPTGALAWRFHLDFAEDVAFEGRIAPQSRWQHEATFELQDINALLSPWIADLPSRLRVAGLWTGSVNDGVLAGQLRVDRLDADRLDAVGDFDVRVEDRTLSLTPRQLTLSADSGRLGPVVIDGGTITTDGRRVDASGLTMRGYGAEAAVRLHYDHDAQSGRAQVTWRGHDEAMGLSHDGDVDVAIVLPSIGRMVVRADWSGFAAMAEGQIQGSGSLHLEGRDWTTLSGTIRSDRLRVQREDGRLDLDGLNAAVAMDWPRIRVPRFTFTGEPIEGTLAANASDLTWSASLTARSWDASALFAELPAGDADVDLRASGTTETIRVDRLSVKQLGRTAQVSAVWKFGESQEPLSFDAAVTAPIPATETVEATGAASLTISGRGALVPLDIALNGSVAVDDLIVSGRALLPIDVRWNGRLLEDRLDVETPQLQVIGGLWSAEASFERAGQAVRVHARGHDIKLERLIELAQVPVTMSGSVAAEVHVLLPALDLRQLELDGAWEADSLVGPGLIGASARGEVRMQGDAVTLGAMQLQQDEGTITGRAEFRLSAPDRVTLDLQGDRWPFAYDVLGLAGEVNGTAELLVDLVSIGADGTIDLHGELNKGDRTLGRFSARGVVEGRSVDLGDMTFDGFGGGASGTMLVKVDEQHWQQSVVDLQWSDIDLSQVERYLPDFADLSGSSSGTLRISRSEQPRAIEPMEVRIESAIQDGAYGAVSLERFDLTGFFGPHRVVIDRAVLAMADGELSSWIRVRRHDDEFALHVQLDFADIDIDQVAALLSLSDEPMPGRAEGSIVIGGYPFSESSRIFGSGKASLRDSELVGLPGFREIYGLVNLDFSRGQPRGIGEAEIRVENGAVEISRLTYFNRGTDVIARLRIHDFWAGESSPISGVAVGAARPLRDLRLPFIRNLDRLLGAVQSDMSSVRVSGTLADREVTVVPFAQVGATIRRILTAPE